MQTQPTTSEIVRQIIETLSESISALTLLVVERKATNAEIPPTLPSAVEAVSKAADTLVFVARDLANSEYSEFPDIQSEIIGATNEVEKAISGLRSAISDLSRVERARGWQTLADSCGTIGKKTIRLLEIVYGAEIKKVLASAERARQALRETERLGQNNDDPQGFADSAGKASGEINQLAQHLSNVADAQAAPGTRDELKNAAQALEKKAQQLIDEANNVLSKPDDPQAKTALTRVIKETNDIIDNAKLPLKEDLGTDATATEDAAAQLKALLQRLPQVAVRAEASPNDPAALKELNDLLDQIEDLVHKIGDNTGGAPEIEKIRKQAMAVIARMRPAQKGGDWKNNLLAAAQDLAGQMALLLGEAQLEVAKTHGDAADAARELEGLLEGLEKKTRAGGQDISTRHVNDLLNMVSSLESAHSSSQATSPDKVVGKIQTVSDNISKATKRTKLAQRDAHDPIIEAYDSIAEQMGALARAAKAGDGNGILLSARALGAFIQKLVAMLRDTAAKCPRPAERDQLYKLASALSDFAVQVKILASVKAASATPDTANDGQLVALTTNLGKVLEQALTTVDIVKLMS